MVDNAVEVLNSQLPRYFRPVIEFQEIMKAHGHGLGRLDGVMARLQANFYIPTCDEATIAYYERLLGISCNIGDELDFRRMRVLQKLNIIVPFTIDFLRDRLTDLFGKDGFVLEEDSPSCALTIMITSDRHRAVDLLFDLLLEVLPAHLQLAACQEVNTSAAGRLYVGGTVFTIFEQTIYKDTVTAVEDSLYTAGGVLRTFIQTIGRVQEG